MEAGGDDGAPYIGRLRSVRSGQVRSLGREGLDDGSLRDGVTLGLEAVLVSHPGDLHSLALGSDEAVLSLHDGAELLADLLQLTLHLSLRRTEVRLELPE